ncbi:MULTISPECIES: cysteine desulfurase family protein [Paenibacillus]|uniref:cysteine desulfurase family protein n=1 Tax=Paenibacillus TaxID=44249 RepID=UPI0022B8770A|nr:cysteine desulfurase family protein [Paenibacillus caseinilyticus]MCZ8523412.1 cysteine desulfurase family protein [Paenibacillus caseinilyticus]
MSVIYLDNCATTPCRREIAEAMTAYFCEEFGNPSSQHLLGKKAKHAVNGALAKVARFIGAEPDEIVLTSGATESNNLALFGVFDVHEKSPVNAVFCPTDHKSSLDIAKELQRRGIGARYAEVQRNGRICLDSLQPLIDEHTRILSIAYVNSEVGTIQEIEKIARLCADRHVILHVDAVQAAGKLELNVKDLGIGALSLSAHKIYGPKGIGALYVDPEVARRMRPILFGGGQNRLRSGTLPTPLIVGLGMACEMIGRELDENYEAAERLRDYLVHALSLHVDEFVLTTDCTVSVPYILNVQFPGVSSETLVTGLRDVALSSGSACNSASLEPSYVLTAIGLTKEEANSSLRFCLHPGLTFEDIDRAVDSIARKIHSMKCISTF